MTRRMITQPDGSLLNTCTSDAVIQMLRFLKRAYWPFAWDSSQGLAADSRGLGIGGGFADAAQVIPAVDLRDLQSGMLAWHQLPLGAGVLPFSSGFPFADPN